MRQAQILLIGIFQTVMFVGLAAQDTTLYNQITSEIHVLARQNRIDEAVNRCNEVLAQYRSQEHLILLDDVLMRKANLMINSGRADSTLATYESGAQMGRMFGIDSSYVKFKVLKLQALKMFGRIDEAQLAIRELLPISVAHRRDHSILLQEYAALGQYSTAINDSTIIYLDSALVIARDLHDSLRMSSVLEALGTWHYNQGAYLSAVDNFLESAQYITNATQLKKVDLLLKVGGVFVDMQQWDKARSYSEGALTLSQDLGYNRAIARCHNQIGTVAAGQLQFDVAMVHFEKAEAYFDSRTRPNDICATKCNIADLYLKEGRFDKAEAKLDEISAAIQHSSTTVQSRYFRFRGQIHNHKGQYSTALDAANRALELARIAPSTQDVIAAMKLQKQAFERLGEYAQALATTDALQHLSDSLFALKQTQLLFDTEARYRKAEQDKAIASLNAQNEIKDMTLETRRRQMILGMIALVALIGLAIVMYRRAITRKKHGQILEEKNSLISRALQDKELLLREIHHRVKNNLQVVSSLLSLQSRFIEDETALAAINQGRDRVKSMALIHQNLYQEENLTGIQIKAYFEKLIQSLFNSYNVRPDQITLVQNVSDLELDVDTVIPLGLVVNELVSNALKYAFPDGREGTITVALTEKDEQLVLEVKDDGIGISADWSAEQGNSFGFRLIHAFKAKLNADLDVSGKNGTAVTMRIRDYQKAG